MRANNGVCENFVRYTDGDGNFLRCIATNIENGNPFLNWYANQCYGSKTCDSAQLAYGGMAVDLECLSKFQVAYHFQFGYNSFYFKNHLCKSSNVSIKF